MQKIKTPIKYLAIIKNSGLVKLARKRGEQSITFFSNKKNLIKYILQELKPSSTSLAEGIEEALKAHTVKELQSKFLTYTATYSVWTGKFFKATHYYKVKSLKEFPYSVQLKLPI